MRLRSLVIREKKTERLGSSPNDSLRFYSLAKAVGHISIPKDFAAIKMRWVLPSLYTNFLLSLAFWPAYENIKKVNLESVNVARSLKKHMGCAPQDLHFTLFFFFWNQDFIRQEKPAGWPEYLIHPKIFVFSFFLLRV